jgi:hypothetical protein
MMRIEDEMSKLTYRMDQGEMMAYKAMGEHQKTFHHTYPSIIISMTVSSLPKLVTRYLPPKPLNFVLEHMLYLMFPNKEEIMIII